MPLNLLIVRRALNGKRATYSIAKHPKLHLAADGKGGGSWRIKYRPRPGATQRWFTISNDARNIALEYVVRRATELLSNLSLNGVDPQSPRPNDEVTFDRTFTLRIERHGKVHKKSWREDEALYRRHIKARVLGERQIRVDFVLVDAKMRGPFDGFALSQWVRMNRPEIRTILSGTPPWTFLVRSARA